MSKEVTFNVRSEEMGVTAKWRGTAGDQRDMEKLQLAQQVRRNFGRTAMFGFSSTLICTWEITLGSLGLTLMNGGTAGLFWNYVVVVIGFTFVYLSIAELGSIIPTAGGQYYWVSVLSPPKSQRYLSYVTGWLCATAWQTGICSSAFLAGTIIQGLLILNKPDYVPHPYQGTLFVWMIVAVAIFFNTALAKKLPIFEILIVLVHLLGALIIIPLWVLAPRNSAHNALLQFTNDGGWSTTGTSTMVGMLSVVLSLLGLDCSVHMAEEIKDSSINLPMALLIGFGINGLLGFLVVVTACFTVVDVDDILSSPTGYLFLQYFYSTTKSFAGTNVMAAIMSKLAHDVPLNALGVSVVISILLSLINIGSTAALNAIFSLNTASLLTSYMITIGSMLLWRLRGKPIPRSRWTLGRYGFANVGAMCYLLPVFVFSFFPSVTPPTPETMNWGVVMYSGVIIFSTVYYILYGRHHYQPPTRDVGSRLVMDNLDI
ncbi:putative GABA permease [Rhizodiscina lignyota]|uniref:GABA permease n=1 Tax=Rhizodiscina lignyota TaxID=1504668 RepID=A0A9P4IH38_9PEZI|nr:putative GABA permease [Rhizodiscina lignyota]